MLLQIDTGGGGLSDLSNNDLLLIVMIGLAVGWLASMMSGGGFIKNFLWALIGAFIGAIVLPNSLGAASGINLGSPEATLAAYTALGAIFCALVAQVLT